MASLYKINVGEEQEFHRVLADGGFTAELAKRIIKRPYLVRYILEVLFHEGVPEIEENFDDNPELEGEAIRAAVEEAREYFWKNPDQPLVEAVTETLGPKVDTDREAALAVLSDLFYENGDFYLHREPSVIFDTAEWPRSFLFDTIYEVIRQTLLRDPAIREEYMRREEREELKGQVWQHGPELPSVEPAKSDDTCEFQWWLGGADSGSMLDPYCHGAAQVRLGFDYGEEPRCLDHANWDIADTFLKITGTPREGNAETPPDLKEVIDGWLREKLKRATER